MQQNRKKVGNQGRKKWPTGKSIYSIFVSFWVLFVSSATSRSNILTDAVWNTNKNTFSNEV